MPNDDRFLLIPISVAEDPRADWPAKIIWSAVYGYSRTGGSCWMSLDSMAALCQRSRRQVSDYLRQLRDLGWIEVAGMDGRRRLLVAQLPSPYMATDRDDGDPPPRSRPTATVEIDREAEWRPTARQSGSGPPPIKIQDKKKEKKSLSDDEKKSKARPRDLDEVRAYFEQIGADDPEGFLDYWISRGWTGRNGSIKDWRAAARTYKRLSANWRDKKVRQLDRDQASRWLDQ